MDKLSTLHVASPGTLTAVLRKETVKHRGSQREGDLGFPILSLRIGVLWTPRLVYKRGPDTHPRKPPCPSLCIVLGSNQCSRFALCPRVSFGGQRHVQGETPRPCTTLALGTREVASGSPQLPSATGQGCTRPSHTALQLGRPHKGRECPPVCTLVSHSGRFRGTA